MAAVIIIIIVLLAVIIAVLFTRVLRIEKEVTIVKNDDDDFIPDITLDENDVDEPEEKEPEMVDLVDYFSDAETKEGKEKPANNQADEIFVATDKLTEFKKGRGYLVECKKTLEAGKDIGNIYCAAYFDYDRFSFINNLKGAASGDYVLTQTAQQLRRIFPENSLITRASCDHFVVMFPLVDLALFDEYYDHLRHMSEKIRNDIAVKTGMRISVGFATTDNDNSYDINVLISRANVARHCAKVTKSEKYEVFDDNMCPSHFFGDTLMENYSDCQYGDEFVVYYETMLDLVSDKIVGCDTFIRWSCEDNGDGFISQDSGRIPTNNEKVVYQACRAMGRWRKAGREVVPTLVELPVTDLFKVDVDDFIIKCLVEFQVDPGSLIVKIDVGIVRLDWSTCAKQIKKLKESGLKICIFNMDTGYTNLEFLSGLPIDYIKLHKSFMHNIDSSDESLEKCRKMIERAHAVGAQVIFEGVDSVEQASAMRSIGAKMVEGKYSGKPTLADEMTRVLPEYIENRLSDQTVILSESDFIKGNYDLF